MALLDTYNASYTLLGIAWFQAHMLSSPRIMALLTYGHLDNVNPRELETQLEKKGASPDALAEVRRRWAAHANCVDGLPMIIAAVLAGNAADLPARFMNTMVASYIGFRILFVMLYARQKTFADGFLRTFSFILAQLCWVVTFYKASKSLNP